MLMHFICHRLRGHSLRNPRDFSAATADLPLSKAGKLEPRSETRGCYPRADRDCALHAGPALRSSEAALLHWLYLSHSPRSRMSPPPSDLELGSLDARRLRRLARSMVLSEPLESWLDHVGASGRKQTAPDPVLSRRQTRVRIPSGTPQRAATAKAQSFTGQQAPPLSLVCAGRQWTAVHDASMVIP